MTILFIKWSKKGESSVAPEWVELTWGKKQSARIPTLHSESE